MSGWIKLHRSITSHWLFEDPEFFRAWIIMVTQANFESKKRMFNGVLIEVKRGDFIFGLEAFSATSKMTISKLRRFLKLLENEQMISRQKTNKYSMISITNYDEYQSDDRQSNKQTTNKQQANDRQSNKLATTPKEVEKERIKELKDISPAGDKRKRKVQLPKDFDLSKQREKLACDYWKERGRIDLSPTDEFNKFQAHHLAKASVSADWDRSWQTWYSNAVSFNKPFGVSHANNQQTRFTPAGQPQPAGFTEKHTDTGWAEGLQG